MTSRERYIMKYNFVKALSYNFFLQPKSRQRLTVSEDREDLIGDEAEVNNPPTGKRGRGRRRKKRNFAGELIDDKKIEDDEAPPVLSAQKQIQMTINLSEINRKLITVNPVFQNLHNHIRNKEICVCH